MKKKTFVLGLGIALCCVASGARAQYLVSGNDEKRGYDESGKMVELAPGKDTVSIIDIRNRVEPKIVATLPLKNSIHGPPTNVAITPDNRIALIANAVDAVTDNGKSYKNVPDDEVYVVDLTASPPKIVETLHVGKQPSGIAINHAGTFALIADRAENAISVLRIGGMIVKYVGSVPLSAPNADPTAIAITPDGSRALVTLTRLNKVAVLAMNDAGVSDTGYAMTTGLSPYNVQITPDGKLGLVNNQGAGASDGQVDTLSVIDMEASPPRVIDQVAVGDGPEGLAVSPVGSYAASLLLNGTGAPKPAFYHHDHSLVALLKIDGKKVRKVGEALVHGGAEGIAFSPDGRFLYVGGYNDSELAILRLQGEKLMNVGAFKLPGHPASLRGNTP
ncbi:MAG TPA: YncE family protein [Stellaceae bacterium]|jgi:DNA-binding beta-propeller fold protein YncE|nr:YncE family protein [Stellaceae bacterium]